ncbi:MAG: O-antigen ligase family protein [Ferruginibacter sp.]|nr:O-antigen ligase family protein [Chitinophagaceae bacterium]
MTNSGKQSVTLFAFLASLFIAFIGVAVVTGQYLLVIVPFALLLFVAGWQNKNQVFFLLIAALPFSVEYNFSPGLGTDIPDEFLMLLVSLVFFASWLHSPRSVSKDIRQHPLLFLLVPVVCWWIITIIFSSDPQVSVKYLLAKSWYLGAFVLAPLLVFTGKKSITITGLLLAGSMLVVAAIALLRHSGDGFSFATTSDAVSPFFRNHVNYSALLVCTLPIWVAFFQLTPRKKERVVVAGIIAFVLLALYFSYARGAWLALLAGGIAWWLIKKRLLLYSYLVAVTLAICLLFWVKSNDRYLDYAPDYTTTIFHKDFNEHFVATYQLKDLSTAERLYRWVAGVRMIKENWLTGYGPNTFYDNYRGYTVPAYKTWVSDNPEHSTVHNYFLLTAVEQGIPGLLFFLILLGAMLYYAQYLYQRVTDLFYKTLALITGVMLVMIIVLNSLSDLIETDKIGSLFFLCLSLLIITDITNRKTTNL